MPEVMTPDGIDRQVPFGSGLWLLVKEARSKLAPPGGCIEPTAIADLERGLAMRLGRVVGPSLLAVYERDDPDLQDRRYRAFVEWLADTQFTTVFDAFPVLRELTETVCAQWVTTSNELVGRLEHDLDRIVPDGSRVSRLVSDLGDPHRGGRTVHQVVLSSGASWAYKPRPMAAEAQFYELLRWARAEVDDRALLPRVIDRGAYGWMEFVRAGPTSEPLTFWRRAGELAALLFLCGAEDMHHENLIAVPNQLLPIDLECIEVPWLDPQRSPRSLHIDDSVMATGLFPGVHREGGPIAREVSGLLSRPGRPTGVWIQTWANLGEDSIGRRREPAQASTQANAPLTAGGELLPVDVEAIVGGFEATLERMSARTSPLDSWSSVPARMVFRSTASYARIASAACNPEILEDRERFDATLRSLDPLPASVATLLGPDLDRFTASEVSALGVLDIPLVRCRGTDLELDNDERLASVLPESGATRMGERRDRVAGAGKRVQVELVRLSAEQFQGGDHAPLRERRVLTEPERAKTLEAIGTLAQAIIDEAIEADSRLCWLEVDPGSPLRGAVGLTELYRGSSGIAVFLAAASRLLGNQAWGSAACRALSADDDLESRLDSWERGWPGELYARLTVGRLLNNDSLCDDAAGTFAEGLGRRTTDPGALVDVMGGLSGVLAAALSAVEHGSSDLRGASEVLTDELVDVIQRRRTDPLRERQVHRLGFAHGITGLSYVLLRAANVLDHAAASELGAALIGFEEDRIAVRAGVPGWRPNPTTPPARSWCWGVAGYLASRSSPAVQRARRPTARHVDAALDVLESRDRDRSHLCCGEAGHLVALTTAAAGGNERAAEIGGSIIATLAGNVLAGTRCHFYGSASFDAPSLFWGRAGVGYALCHAIAPDVVPNVLLIG